MNLCISPRSRCLSRRAHRAAYRLCLRIKKFITSSFNRSPLFNVCSDCLETEAENGVEFEPLPVASSPSSKRVRAALMRASAGADNSTSNNFSVHVRAAAQETQIVSNATLSSSTSSVQLKHFQPRGLPSSLGI